MSEPGGTDDFLALVGFPYHVSFVATCKGSAPFWFRERLFLETQQSLNWYCGRYSTVCYTS